MCLTIRTTTKSLPGPLPCLKVTTTSLKTTLLLCDFLLNHGLTSSLLFILAVKDCCSQITFFFPPFCILLFDFKVSPCPRLLECTHTLLSCVFPMPCSSWICLCYWRLISSSCFPASVEHCKQCHSSLQMRQWYKLYKKPEFSWTHLTDEFSSAPEDHTTWV